MNKASANVRHKQNSPVQVCSRWQDPLAILKNYTQLISLFSPLCVKLQQPTWGKKPNNHKKQLILKNNKKDRNCYRKIWQTAKKLISAPSSPCVHMHVSYFNLPRLWRDLNYVENWAILPNYLLSWTLRGGLMRLSSVRGPYSDCGDENPGIKQENIHNCSLLQLFWSACSHKRKRRTPSRRILKEKKHAVSYLVPEQTKAFPFVQEGEGERER